MVYLLLKRCCLVFKGRSIYKQKFTNTKALIYNAQMVPYKMTAILHNNNLETKLDHTGIDYVYGFCKLGIQIIPVCNRFFGVGWGLEYPT